MFNKKEKEKEKHNRQIFIFPNTNNKLIEKYTVWKTEKPRITAKNSCD